LIKFSTFIAKGDDGMRKALTDRAFPVILKKMLHFFTSHSIPSALAIVLFIPGLFTVKKFIQLPITEEKNHYTRILVCNINKRAIPS